MGLRFTVLASGSGGNASLLEADGLGVLIDAGIGPRGERFCDRFDDQTAMIDAFVRHNDAVRAEVPAERLLEWAPGDGWEPICERLGVGVPDQPFPVTNTTDEFREMIGIPPLV